ncbi:MAG: hypothetical protein B7Y39_02835 [Bdellovibrio sp. 28-41-41]|nr:MAG: hypothetical protein B7Y39_02835 [Bdellovibrio sp. 28-41-41]
MIKNTFTLVLVSAFAAVAVASEHEASPAHGAAPAHSEARPAFNGTVLDIRDTPEDFKMPGKLWDIVMTSGAAPAEAGGHGGGKDEKSDTLIVWLPVEVSFTAKVSGILTHDAIQYNLPRGGGTLDLSKITSGDKGTFYLKFNLVEFNNPSAMKVYFVSNAKKRRIDGDVYGAGCNVFFDVTSSFQKSNSGEGIRFNITNNRHISALSGHFIFVQSEKDKVYLSQVEFNDSKNRDYLCKI